MRRHQRMAGFKKSGKLEANGPEPVKVMTCSGTNAVSCKSSVYLGSMIAATRPPEIRRHAVIAWSIHGDLNHIWQSCCSCWKLKGQLSSAFVLTVVLYNAEVWPLTDVHMTRLKGNWKWLVRSLCNRATRMRRWRRNKRS